MYSVPMKNTAYIPQMNRPRTTLRRRQTADPEHARRHDRVGQARLERPEGGEQRDRRGAEAERVGRAPAV